MVPASIALLAAEGPGRYVCPKCNGGSDEETSLSLKIEGADIYWKCFRALCGYSGGPRWSRLGATAVKKEPRYYTRPVRPLTPDQEDLIYTRYQLESGELAGYNEIDDRFILPVFGPDGYNCRGCVAYSLSGKQPKSLNYNKKPDQPFIHWADGGRSIVLVEDWFSAEKVATAKATGVALMGTHLSQEMVTEIAERANGPTYLALDRDAYCKTIGYLAKYREQFPKGLFAWRLLKDLKYETTTRIKSALDGKNDFTSDVGTTECV